MEVATLEMQTKEVFHGSVGEQAVAVVVEWHE